MRLFYAITHPNEVYRYHQEQRIIKRNIRINERNRRQIMNEFRQNRLQREAELFQNHLLPENPHQISSQNQSQQRREELLHQQSTAEDHSPHHPESPQNLCVICSDFPREIVFDPCHHLISCHRCSQLMDDRCPICRTWIERKIRPIRS